MSKRYPIFYYECPEKQWDKYTTDMSDAMKKGFANALAHGMLPLKRTDKGVWMTREDYLLPGRWYNEGKPSTSLVDNEGQWHYFKAYEE